MARKEKGPWQRNDLPQEIVNSLLLELFKQRPGEHQPEMHSGSCCPGRGVRGGLLMNS